MFNFIIPHVVHEEYIDEYIGTGMLFEVLCFVSSFNAIRYSRPMSDSG